MEAINELMEEILNTPGFIYKISNKYYYLGKWICKECTDLSATDCHAMYEMYVDTDETKELALYFNKIRAYSDFALDIPHNPVKIREDMKNLFSEFSSDDTKFLKEQLNKTKSCLELYSIS